MGHEYLERTNPNALLTPTPSYLEPPEPVPTGDAYVDHGTVCDPKDPAHEALWRHNVDDNCFMTPGQREREVSTFRQYVADAHVAYGSALQDLRVDELLKKAPDGSWILELLLDAIGLVAVPAITRALKKLFVPATDAVAERAIRRTSSDQLSAIVRQAVSSAKRVVPRPANDAATDRKTATLGYLDLLRDQAETCFQRLAQGAPAVSTDADLMVLTEAYKVENGHHAADYKRELEGRLSHFKGSGVASIGIAANEDTDPTHLFKYDRNETKAFWVLLPMGKRLALYTRGHASGMEPRDWHPGLLGIYNAHFISTEESRQLKERDLERRPFKFERYVPDDLVDIAVQMHSIRWGAAPLEHDPTDAEWPAVAGARR